MQNTTTYSQNSWNTVRHLHLYTLNRKSTGHNYLRQPSATIGRSFLSYHNQNVQYRFLHFHIIVFRIGNSMIGSDISKLLRVISRAVRRVKFETILKYHEWYLCQISCTNHAIICSHYYTRKWFLIFTCRYFKLIISWNTTALSQSYCIYFSCSSII